MLSKQDLVQVYCALQLIVAWSDTSFLVDE